MNKFNFENYLKKNGFCFDYSMLDRACENNNGYVIYFPFEERLFVYHIEDDMASLVHPPKTEKEAEKFLKSN